MRSSLLTDKPDIGKISQPLAPLFTKVDTSINLAELVSLWFHGAAMMEEAMGQLGFFALPDHLKRLSEAGDPLEEMAQVIDFDAFRPTLKAALFYGDGAKGGRPPYDPVAM